MNFRAITLDDQKAFTRITLANPEYLHYQSIFGVIYVWKEFYHSRIYFGEGFLILEHQLEEKFFTFILENQLLLPKVCGLIEQYCLANQFPKIVIKALSFEENNYLQSQKYTSNLDRNDGDYIYQCSDLANLIGKKYHAKRNFVNRFNLNYAYEVHEYQDQDYHKLMDFYQKWKITKEGVNYLDETQAIDCALKNQAALQLKTIIFFHHQSIIGFTTISLAPNVPFSIFEKGDIHYEGIYQFINNYVAINYLQEFTLVNRAEDLGLEGLRKAKLSYFPLFILEKYQAIKNLNANNNDVLEIKSS
ncbi:MAG: phosphatidylglycerol lysyltransferase domain-containing protein [Acholeplasmatales bacterium]|jgi:hypothetical protein|nr:phosphatidylglycerol lysyltransferase domain-containing protein [Acholeplasmatales bacterium]